ncbi:MAG: ATP-binding protein [Candidatus Bipolaricaulota bacterium]
MRIAIASGKGGTGKTTVAVSLALALRQAGPVQLVDCDVEEPNDHLFLRPELSKRESVELLVPQVDEDKCTRCRACADACRYGALAVIEKGVLVHSELCHGCGLCAMVCPEGAITEVPRTIGWIDLGRGKGLDFLQGMLNVGEPMASPIIKQLKDRSNPNQLTILDVPPGTGCPVIAALKGADFALLVAEPTPFGLHDLKAAVEVSYALALPVGVVVNRHGIGTDQVDRYCEQEGIPVLLRIPMDRRIAAAYARGEPLVEAFPEWKEPLIELHSSITNRVAVAR